jgi:synaptotagmin-like protein
MDFSNSPDNYERTPPTSRRILRQSTLPNPTEIPVFSSSLKLPSPVQHVSPQYSPYHTDNENESVDGETSSGQQPQRYQIRRQSTLPCKPNELYVSQSSKYLSTSPNRSYSRSPDPSALGGAEGDKSPRFCPPFVRQATFPSNSSNGISVPSMEYHQRQLPTSPNRLTVNKSPENPNEMQVSPRRFMRQTTLPNPDQHMKLLPTSPPNKKSPQYHKRSPEFQRQNTISNPEGMSTLSVHHSGPKFLPISPRQKQNFLFPQPAPRAFLSQQHFPTTNEEHAVPQHPQSKMIKVRSHSNEEYSFSRSLPPPNQEGRRLLPEIPNRARSPSRLVRQEHVKDEGEKRSPVLKTFADAMQNQEYESQYTSEYSELNSTFAEADENNYIENNSYEAPNTSLQYAAEQTMEYYNSDEYMRQVQKRVGRRMSRELPPDPEVIISVSDESARKNKPETMRSISEDTNPKTMKIIPRRSFSQPEKDSIKKQKSDSPQQSPKLLADEAPQLPPQKEQCDENDEAQNKVPKKPTYKFPKMLEMRGDSKSFDYVVRQVIHKNDNTHGADDDKSQSMDDNMYSDKKEVSINFW